ncbi:hypothetical protein ACWF99_29910 [Nocardia sp. NPDC055002]|uniref:hypothetical protein n=1 Tax=Nocardia sp. NPDC056952 TaxID=3345979 RepID=UPI0036309B36
MSGPIPFSGSSVVGNRFAAGPDPAGIADGPARIVTESTWRWNDQSPGIFRRASGA